MALNYDLLLQGAQQDEGSCDREDPKTAGSLPVSPMLSGEPRPASEKVIYFIVFKKFKQK